MKKTFFALVTLLISLMTCPSVQAQLPNEKFGKPSSMEWDFVAWGEAPDAKAVVLYKSMEVTYKLSSGFSAYSDAHQDLSTSSIASMGMNTLDFSGTTATYVCKLRTKILKEGGERYANVNIAYFCDKANESDADEIAGLKVRVYSKDDKGKVKKVVVKPGSITDSRLDDNYKVRHIEVPDVHVGDIIEYQYELSSARVTFLYDWSFQEEIPVLYSKCDLDIPAQLQFNMRVPMHPLIKRSVTVGVIRLESTSGDMKAAKSYPTNHYVVEGHDIGCKTAGEEGAEVEISTGEITNLMGTIKNRDVTAPAPLPKGVSHIMIGQKQ